MSWSQGVYAVDGNQEPASLWRLQLQSATRAAQGVIGTGDLKAIASGPASGIVNVSGGACVILGQEAAWQGSYYGFNVGLDPVTIAPTGGTARSDLIIARVEDPTFAGSSWSHNPFSDQLIYSRVVPGVSSATKKAPVGSSAIAIARVDIPAGTSAITQAMITDLRQVANPLNDTQIIAQNGPSGADTEIDGQITTNWTAWPNWFAASVDVPPWATQMKIVGMWGQAFAHATGGTGTFGPINGIRLLVGTIATQETFSNNTDMAPGQTSRRTYICADTINVAPIAGTAVNVVPQGISAPHNANDVGENHMDDSSSMIVQYEFTGAAI